MSDAGGLFAASREAGHEVIGIRRKIGAFVLSAVAVGALGAARGGYFPSSWGWAIVASIVVVVWAALNGRRSPSTSETVFIAGLAALAAWFAISSEWGHASLAIDETARDVVYVSLVAAALVVVRRHSARALAAGALAGGAVVATYALASRLFPDRIGVFDAVAVYRLAAPVGYWNALGLLCAIGLILSVALASTTSSRGSALAGAPAPILAAALYFTFSRGSWLSLFVGLAAALVLCPRRLRLSSAAAALAIPSAVVIAVGSRSAALTHQRATVAHAAHDGHRLALLVVGMVALSAVLAAAAARVSASERAERLWSIALAAAALIVGAVVIGHFGGPVSAARGAWRSFDSPPPRAGVDLRRRLLSFSSDGRIDLWRVALRDFEAHPLAGSGAGSYEAYWLQHRPGPQKVRDAHGLYLETLAELGIVGLVLLLVALAVPLVVGVRTRREPDVAALTGAYVAYLFGAGIDWDWEVTSVTATALLIGVGILAAARAESSNAPPSAPARYGILAAALAVGAFGFVFLVGNMFLSRSAAAAAAGNWTAAARDASRAGGWLPWSTDPRRQLGEAQLAQGNAVAAQHSFEAAIKKDRTDWNLWLDLARASTGKEQAAALRQATKLNPLSPEIAAFKSELGNVSGIDIGVGK